MLRLAREYPISEKREKRRSVRKRGSPEIGRNHSWESESDTSICVLAGNDSEEKEKPLSLTSVM